MSLIFQKLARSNPRNIITDAQILIISCRKLSIVPSIYDGENPAPKFFSSNVQVLLKRLTRPDYNKIFRKRTNQGLTVLKTPTYKFLTNEELEEEIAKANERADRLLQMPPVVKIQQHIEDVLSKDPALVGYDTAKYIFTDITFGVANEHRFIVERDPDGYLRSCDHDVRKRLNQIQDDAGDLSGMSQSTMSLICKQVALAILAQRTQWIKMPQTDAEQNKVIVGFYSLCAFRQVIGAIDCTHIRIPKVGGEIGQYYINRKGYSSINVQVVSNANLEIMDIVAHWRGSTHDSRIFNECRLKQRFEQSEFKGRLLGDSGYACTPYLFTPVLHPTTEKEELYNRAHIRTRNVVERCFGLWKQRFRCLLRGFTTKLENTKLYIVALAVLHNIALHRQDVIEVVEDDDTVPVTQALNNSLRGNSARTAFINENF